ncbi:MAG: hypothetical protein ACQESG_05310 [Nanobdellota archaeon]
MGFIDIGTRPLYDIGTLAAGFYIGYCEGKGIETGDTIEYAAKYGPTAFAVAITPLTIFATNLLGGYMQKTLPENLERSVLEKDGKKIPFKELPVHMQERLQEDAEDVVDLLKSQNPLYLKATASVGTKIACETVIGYTAGRLYSLL